MKIIMTVICDNIITLRPSLKRSFRGYSIITPSLGRLHFAKKYCYLIGSFLLLLLLLTTLSISDFKLSSIWEIVTFVRVSIWASSCLFSSVFAEITSGPSVVSFSTTCKKNHSPKVGQGMLDFVEECWEKSRATAR